MIEALHDPSDIPAIRGLTWLYTAAEGPPLARQHEALARYLANRALAESGRAAHDEVEQRLRGLVATRLGLSVGDIALVSNTSEAMNLLAGVADLRPGDNVVVNDLEFPSVVQPWLRLSGADGVEVRVAEHDDFGLETDAIAALIDDRTRVVAVSHVSYHSGWRHDLAALSEIVASSGALFVLDATQSLGVVPVDGTLADVVVASSYKWLLGGHGLGILAWNRARRPLPDPPAVGWRSVASLFSADRFESYTLRDDARRFEVGYPSFPSIYGLEASLDWLAGFDEREVEAHVLDLTGLAIEQFAERGFTLLTSSDRLRRAGNVAVAHPQGDRLAAWLAEQGVHVWGGDGRFRASFHLFNGEDDVKRLVAALDQAPAASLPPEVVENR